METVPSSGVKGAYSPPILVEHLNYGINLFTIRGGLLEQFIFKRVDFLPE